MENKGKVFSINTSAKKGVSKTGVKTANLIKDFGIEGDAHSGNTHRQISCFHGGHISRVKFQPGDFAENITLPDIT